jgi:hypothetical protein
MLRFIITSEKIMRQTVLLAVAEKFQAFSVNIDVETSKTRAKYSSVIRTLKSNLFSFIKEYVY